MKHSVCLYILMCSMLCIFTNAFAFNDTITHSELSKKAIERSKTSLNGYFEYNLFLQNGIRTEIDGKIIIQWLQYGAEMEDDPPCRASNHFHNPYLDWNASGLSDTLPLVDWWCWTTSPYPPEEIKSNVTWATGYSDRGYIEDQIQARTSRIPNAERTLWHHGRSNRCPGRLYHPQIPHRHAFHGSI